MSPAGLTLAAVVVGLLAVLAWPGPVLRGEPPSGDGSPPGVRARRPTSGPEAPARRSRLPARVRRRHEAAALHDELVHVVGLLSAALAAGVVPITGIRCVAEAVGRDGPMGQTLHRLEAAGRCGDGLGEVWQEQAVRLASDDVAFVGRAWALSEHTGAPLAEALRSAEDVLRTRRRAQERLAAAAAGPRASMAVLAALPAAGPAAGLLVGMSPVSLYLSSPAALGSLALGICLLAFGWWWSRRILATAAREPVPPARGPAGWRGGRSSAQQPVTPGALADAMVLIALAVRSGLALAESLTTVAERSLGPVRRDLGAVVAALRWGRTAPEAWSYAGPQWRPVALAWHLAAESGAAPADLLERTASRVREEQELAAQRRAARAGVLLVLPLGLGFLPAFACTAVVPVVAALAGDVVGG